MLPDSVPWWHFGDLDPDGLAIFAALGSGARRPSLFLPDWWGDYLTTHGLPLEVGWPEPVAEFDGGLLAELRTARRWLEQESILLDPRLGPALAGIGA
jgi:hypothetical protein